MATPRWGVFAGMTILAVTALVGLAHATHRAIAEAEAGLSRPEAVPPEGLLTRGLSTRDSMALLGNVLVSHGLFGLGILGMAWYTGIPWASLGLEAPSGRLIGLGVAIGLGLYVGNELAARLADRVGVAHAERLRELLAPRSRSGWVVLLVGVLPVIAFVEELLFRGALIGAVAAGYPVPIWGLAVLSSIAFGLGHGLQGPGGVVVTGTLGFVLAAAFILTGSLTTVVVAHYLINVLEFLVHEGPWALD